MRFITLFAALILAPGTALAGSITATSGMIDPDGSIIAIGCPSCAEEAKKPEMPPLAPGQEIVRIEHAGEKTMIHRTSNWLGGSPVTYVREASEADLAALKRQGIDVTSAEAQVLAPARLNAAEKSIAERGGIDREAKTGSIDIATAFDPGDLRLRLEGIEATE